MIQSYYFTSRAFYNNSLIAIGRSHFVPYPKRGGRNRTPSSATSARIRYLHVGIVNCSNIILYHNSIWLKNCICQQKQRRKKTVCMEVWTGDRGCRQQVISFTRPTGGWKEGFFYYLKVAIFGISAQTFLLLRLSERSIFSSLFNS